MGHIQRCKQNSVNFRLQLIITKIGFSFVLYVFHIVYLHILSKVNQRESSAAVFFLNMLHNICVQPFFLSCLNTGIFLFHYIEWSLSCTKSEINIYRHFFRENFYKNILRLFLKWTLASYIKVWYKRKVKTVASSPLL